jgi:hypothetical protein
MRQHHCLRYKSTSRPTEQRKLFEFHRFREIVYELCYVTDIVVQSSARVADPRVIDGDHSVTRCEVICSRCVLADAGRTDE